MDLSAFLEVINIIEGVFGVAGAVLIVYGGLRAAITVLLLEFGQRSDNYNHIRNEFTSKIVFGLEFLIAAVILKTLVTPSQEELFNLAVVVAIRTILGYFLQKEARDFSLE